MKILHRTLLALALTFATRAGGEPCPKYLKAALLVEPASQSATVQSIHQMPLEVCEPFPKTGYENLRLDVYDLNGQLVFTNTLFANTQTQYDYSIVQSNQRKLRGGQLPSSKIFLYTLIPLGLAITGNKIFELHDIQKPQLMGRGKL